MVRRSLVFKITLYTVVVFALSLPLAFMAARSLIEVGHRENLRQMESIVGPRLSFIRDELEQSAATGRPLGPRIAQLSAAFNVSLQVVPWNSPRRPAALAHQAILLDHVPFFEHPRHWLRLDRDGRPVTAIELSPGPMGLRHGHPPLAPLLMWSALLVLVIVPPLYLWVVRPLRAMVGVARRLGNGDLDTPVALDRRDEFGELERAFERMRVELRRVIEQQERLLSDVSHEIRGPLARMMIALPLLRREGASGPVTDIFEHEIRAVDSLLSEVLALARGNQPAALRLTPIDLSALAARLLEERALQASEKPVIIETALASAPLMADERLVTRAIGNLLDNALKYTLPGNHVCVESGLREGRPYCRIADDGPGIAPRDQAQIFEPFYRPDSSRSRETGGVGLGLAIVKRIVEAHGGAVTLESQPGYGTVVEVLFAAAKAAVERSAIAPSSSLGAS